MAKRPPHTLPYATHQWVGELLYQARNTLVHVSMLLGNSYSQATMFFCGRTVSCSPLVARLDKVRSQLDDTLFVEHGQGLQPHTEATRALLRVYYPESPLWHTRLAYDSYTASRRRRRPGGKWWLTWQDHLSLAEMLFQCEDMLRSVWGTTLRAYGATDPKNRLLETLVPSGTALSRLQCWCQDRMHEAEERGILQWPPDLSRDLYTNGRKYFTPWATLYPSPALEIPA